CLSVTLLMPGTTKSTSLSRAFLHEYCIYLRGQLLGQGFDITQEEPCPDPAGDAYFFVLSAATDPYQLKTFTILLEEEFLWARVLDLDLYLSENRQVSRSDINSPERSCLICGEMAHVCSRSQRHPTTELQQLVRQYQCAGLLQLLPERMGAAATAAALSELLVAPKPGLVTGSDSGSHPDMDRFTYAESIAALRGYFEAAAACGLRKALYRNLPFEAASAEDPDENFLQTVSELHRQGLRAERQMFAATGGVNTQKGFIYLSGIVLASAAALALDPFLFALKFGSENETRLIERWQQEIRRWTQALHSVQKNNPGQKATAGETFNRLYGVEGVRGEAAAGLKNVFQLALPFYRGLRRRNMGQNEASVVTLLLLLSAVDDTTLIKRAGLQRAQEIREELAKFFNMMSRTDARCPEQLKINPSCPDSISDKDDPDLKNALSDLCLDNIAAEEAAVIAYIKKWSGYFKEKGYSAGGAADLLAVCLLVLKLLTDI
ncbi:MAG: triphosphoribosyl-dephospho-CoA synthase, partial [Eubacteriales bacterium]|nr:triphosphoribosyl-dephospho-CoA synthase [Eubacteriales bacterium]